MVDLTDINDAALITELWRRGYSVVRPSQYGLTPRQMKVYSLIQSRLQSGQPAPSMREIAEHIDKGKSPSSAHRIVRMLVERGVIRRLPHRARSITLTGL
jgi:SOS-response transcriptional repressor LexA